MPTPIDTEHVMNYIECELGAEITHAQWRLARAAVAPRRRHPLRRILRAALTVR